MKIRCIAALAVGFHFLSLLSGAAEPQNPSPMVEHTREHRRLKEEHPPGQRLKLERGTLFIPEALAGKPEVRLLVMLHGGTWIPEVAAARAGCAVLSWQAPVDYALPFAAEGAFQTWTTGAAQQAQRKWTQIELAGWSAGCGGIRQILQHAGERAAISRVWCIDGIHASYRNGKPGPKESDIDPGRLNGLVEYARIAIAGKKQLLVLHTEIFPGTFASTTETADWLLRELSVPRTAVLRWGPMGSQQLSEAGKGGFGLRGYAGNAAPDHVDLLHALPELLAMDGGPEVSSKE